MAYPVTVNPRPLHAGLGVDTAALGQVFLRVLEFPP